MRAFTTTILTGLVIALLPFSASAATSAAYATDVLGVSNQVYQPINALGEPDSSYADFFDKNAYVTLDFGQDIESDVTLHIFLLKLGAAARIDFLDSEQNVLDSTSIIFNINEPEVRFTFDGDGKYRYVKITSLEEEIFKLDSVEVLIPEEEPVPELMEEPVPELYDEPVDETDNGRLITLADDGDSATHHDESVYVVGSDGMRHAFPSETVFFSWWENFDDVEVVSATEMSSFQLGSNVTVRAGTHLVKITANPNVYAVEPGGILRWVTTEEIAIELYGEDWAERVRDLPDVFWGNYELGEPIESTIHPTGTLGVIESTDEVVYIQNALYYSLPSGSFSFYRFNEDFYALVSDTLIDLYVDGGELAENDPAIAYPY